MNDSITNTPPASENADHSPAGQRPTRGVLDHKAGGVLSEADARRQIAGYLALALTTGVRFSEVKQFLETLQKRPDCR